MPSRAASRAFSNTERDIILEMRDLTDFNSLREQCWSEDGEDQITFTFESEGGYEFAMGMVAEEYGTTLIVPESLFPTEYQGDIDVTSTVRRYRITTIAGVELMTRESHENYVAIEASQVNPGQMARVIVEIADIMANKIDLESAIAANENIFGSD